MLITLLAGLDDEVEINADMDMAVNGVSFKLLIDGNAALIGTDSWSDAFKIARYTGVDPDSLRQTISDVDHQLKRLNITVSIRRPGIAVLGPGARPFYASLFRTIAPIVAKKS